MRFAIETRDIYNPYRVRFRSPLSLLNVICLGKLPNKISLCIAVAVHVNAMRFRVYDAKRVFVFDSRSLVFDLHSYVSSSASRNIVS